MTPPSSLSAARLSAELPVPEPAEVVVLPIGDADDEGERQPLLGKTPIIQTANREVLGLSFMAISALLFSVMSVLVKLAGNSFPSLEVVLIRSIIQFVLGVCGCLYVGVPPWGPSTLNKLWLLARGAAGSTGLALYFFTIINLPLGDGITIFFTGPAFTAVLARITLGEPLTVLDVWATIACLVGVTLVARPEFLFRPSDVPTHSIVGDKVPASWAALAAFLGAIMSAVAYCIVRKIGKRAHFMVHVTYFGGVSTVLSAIALHFLQEAVPVSAWTVMDWITVLSVGLAAYIAQCFLNAGLQLANAGPASLMRNLDIVFAFAFGLWFFHEVPTLTSILGATIVLGATGTVAMVKWWRSRSQ